MKDLVIYGAGGFGRELFATIRHRTRGFDSQWQFAGFYDDGLEIGTSNEYGSVVGGFEQFNAIDKPTDAFIAVADPRARMSIINRLTNSNINFPNILDDCIAIDPDNYSLGRGNILIRSTFSINITIGDFNIFNDSIVLGHDVKIGNFNTLMPESRVSGCANLGDQNYLGAKSFVLQYVKVGNGVTLSAGSTLLRRPKDFSTYVGNPAKKLKL